MQTKIENIADQLPQKSGNIVVFFFFLNFAQNFQCVNCSEPDISVVIKSLLEYGRKKT